MCWVLLIWLIAFVVGVVVVVVVLVVVGVLVRYGAIVGRSGCGLGWVGRPRGGASS